jgi:hypothetical protein
VVDALCTLQAALRTGPLTDELAEHVTRKERTALADRVDQLLRHRVFPAPSGDYPAIPWPAF